MPNTPVPAVGEAMLAALPTMTLLAIALLLLAAALRTRLFRLWLAVRILRVSNIMAAGAERLIECVKREGSAMSTNLTPNLQDRPELSTTIENLIEAMRDMVSATDDYNRSDRNADVIEADKRRRRALDRHRELIEQFDAAVRP